MGQERLTNLALINVNYGIIYDFDELIDIFAARHPRKLELDWLPKAKST